MGEVNEKRVPILVKVISVFSFISAGIHLISIPLLAMGLGFTGDILFLLLEILSLALAIFLCFIGYGLWKGRGWARYSAIFVFIYYALGPYLVYFLRGQGNMLWNIFNTILYLIIAGYLFVNNKVKESFSSNEISNIQ